MFGDQYNEHDLGLCICCEEAAATEVDASQASEGVGGWVCLFCKTLLDAADVRLHAVPGLGGWQPIPRGGVQL